MVGFFMYDTKQAPGVMLGVCFFRYAFAKEIYSFTLDSSLWDFHIFANSSS
jgi:hypothetical protein